MKQLADELKRLAPYCGTVEVLQDRVVWHAGEVAFILRRHRNGISAVAKGPQDASGATLRCYSDWAPDLASALATVMSRVIRLSGLTVPEWLDWALERVQRARAGVEEP